MNQKIDFIIAVNNDKYFEECCKYINSIRVPEGYSINIKPIYGAKSMCAAYNQAISLGEADYRVYIHQDVFILNEDFINDFIKIFDSDDKIGMIGMMGATKLPDSGMALYTFDAGKVATQDPDMAYILQDAEEANEIRDVQAVDGVCIITRHDLPWREDLFTHFDFYDISQSLEMKRAGYRVVVPSMERPWILHECGFAKMKSYMSDAAIAVNEYPEFFTEHIEAEYEHNDELESLCHNFSALIKSMINNGQWQEAIAALEQYKQLGYKDTEIEILRNICTIWQYDPECYIVSANNYDEIYDRYVELRFDLRAMEFGKKFSMLYGLIRHSLINEKALYFCVIKMCFDWRQCFGLLRIIAILYRRDDLVAVMKQYEDKFADKKVNTAVAKMFSKEENY